MGMSTGDGNPEYEKMIETFTGMYPWITIESEFLGIGDEYANMLSTRLKGNDAPDVFHVGGGRATLYSVLPYMDEGLIMDLSGFSWAQNAVPEAYHDIWWSGSQLGAIPLSLAPVIVEYNEAMFNELGIPVPTTMDEFMAAGAQAVAAGQPFIVLSGAHVQHSAHFIISIAASTVYLKEPAWNEKRETGEVTFAGTPGWKEAIEIFMRMNEAGLFVPGSEGMDANMGHEALANGDGMLRVCPAGNINIVERINDSTKLLGMAMPGATADQTGLTGMLTDGVAAFSGTKYPEEVSMFMDFVATGGGADIWAVGTGNIAVPDIASGTVKNPKLAGIEPLFKQGGRVFNHPQSAWTKTAAFQALGNSVQALMTGQTTVDEVIAGLDAAWDAA
jgi:raffinose/stachyose/melibiose transport system substrate-binding protein